MDLLLSDSPDRTGSTRPRGLVFGKVDDTLQSQMRSMDAELYWKHAQSTAIVQRRVLLFLRAKRAKRRELQRQAEALMKMFMMDVQMYSILFIH